MKQTIVEALDIFQKHTEKYDLKTLEGKITQIKDEMNDFRLKVLFVGSFSAGKSALINTVIGRDLLEEDQVPETAIASELIYDAEEYIEAVYGSDKDLYKIEDAEMIDTKKYDYLIWHLNSKELKDIGNAMLVDMPGFNSGIANHNKAILRYAGHGNAYILVIDCEDGAIKQSIADFIREIKNYDNNLSVAITKTDLKLEEDVEEVRKFVKSNAEMNFGSDIEVITTKKGDSEASKKIEDLIEQFDQDEIFEQSFAGSVYEIGVKCLDSLETYKQSITYSTEDFDEEIKKHQQSKEALIKKLQTEKDKLEQRFRNNVTPAIMSDVQQALYSQTESLARSLKAGEQAFSMAVNNILRPVLVASTQTYAEQSFGKFIDELDFTSIDDAAINELSVHVMDKYKQVNGKIQELAENGQKLNAAYKAVTTALAVTTSVIAPWLELILIFLPDIISLFTRVIKQEEIESRINDEVIPQIVNRMRPEVEKSLVSMKDEMVQQVEAEIDELINSEIDAIAKAEESKKAESAEYESKKADVEKDIEVIKEEIVKLEREDNE